ncbi:hypothetical protein IC582_007059 [Cucumis melo]
MPAGVGSPSDNRCRHRKSPLKKIPPPTILSGSTPKSPSPTPHSRQLRQTSGPVQSRVHQLAPNRLWQSQSEPLVTGGVRPLEYLTQPPSQRPRPRRSTPVRHRTRIRHIRRLRCRTAVFHHRNRHVVWRRGWGWRRRPFDSDSF